MELIPKGSPEYKLILSEYNEVIFNITKDKSYNKFIGGLPITLERKDIYTLMNKDMAGNYNYSITQKADGNRFLLFSSMKQVNKRLVVFIDRNNNIFQLKNNRGEYLPTIPGPRILIDGELICYNSSNKQIPLSDNLYDHKSFSFLCFDILYGPSNIELEGPPEDRRLKIKNEVAMCGPIGGKLWPYTRRYDILYNLIYPNFLNEFKPLISIAFSNIKWFISEIKPIYFINIAHTKQILYQNKFNEDGKQQPEGLFQIKLKKFREDFYKQINNLRDKQEANLPHVDLLNFKLDGLIFTPFNTEYVIGGAWKKFMNIQYKWKPSEEQTIDFAVQKDSNLLYIFKYVPIKINIDDNYIKYESSLNSNSKFEFKYNKDQNNLLIIKQISSDHLITDLEKAQDIINNKDTESSLYLFITYDKFNNIILNASSNKSFYPLNIKKLVPFTINKTENAKISSNFNSELKSLGIKKQPKILIGEFSFDNSKNQFILKNLRLDKTEPNSINTAINVFRAITNPVNIEKIKEFFLLPKLNELGLKKLMNYLTKKQLSRLALICGYNNGKLNLFPQQVNLNLTKNINLFKLNSDYEFEIRIGYIEEHRFQTNLPLTLYQQFYDLLINNNIPFEINLYHDYLKNSYRSRYLFVNDLNNFIHLSTIKKELIENITFDSNYLFNLDIRFSLSNEKQINIEKNPELNIKLGDLESKIYEKKRTTFKLGFVNIDCTEIKEISKQDFNTYLYSIEIELLDRTKPANILINQLSSLLLTILNSINS